MIDRGWDDTCEHQHSVPQMRKCVMNAVELLSIHYVPLSLNSHTVKYYMFRCTDVLQTSWWPRNPEHKDLIFGGTENREEGGDGYGEL